MKGLVVFVVFLIIAAFVGGTLFSDSYWGNPVQAQAEAERMQIENRGMEARQEIDIEAYRDQREAETQTLREQARLELTWKDRWNEVAIVLAVVFVVAFLVLASIRLGGPVFAKIYQRHAEAHTQLLEQRRQLEEKAAEREARQTERLREERRLEQVRLQWARLRHEQLGGNGRERETHTEPLATRSWSSHCN